MGVWNISANSVPRTTKNIWHYKYSMVGCHFYDMVPPQYFKYGSLRLLFIDTYSYIATEETGYRR